jgi:pyruvate formate lyase activating enzyme
MPQLLFNESLCVRCYHCLEVCPSGASQKLADGSVQIKRELCTGCGQCAAVCPTEARVISGRLMTLAEVMAIVKSDELFYRNSSGGVSASGGEPTHQPEFLIKLFSACRELGIHTTLDTCGYTPWEILGDVLAVTDLVYYDIKHMNGERHRALNGVDNRLILDNARRIAASGKPMVLRIPLVPGYNDTGEDVRLFAGFAMELKPVRTDILPLHQFGGKKYQRLGRVYALEDVKTYSEEEISRIKDKFQSFGLEVTVA